MYNDLEKMLTTHKDNFKKYSNIKSDCICGINNRIEKPFITIAIPTYKRSNLLIQAINSAINQLGVSCEYEILIVDNESSNNETDTERVVRSFQSETLLYYRNQENLGMFGNWNRCIELASGEWISFLHDDDILNSNYLNKVCHLLKRKSEIGAISSSFEVFKGNIPVDYNKIKNESNIKTFIRKFEHDKLMRLSKSDSIIMNGNIFGAPTCGSIFRKKYLHSLGGFDEDYFPSADWFLTLKFSINYKFYKSTSLFGYYRILENESLNLKTLKEFVYQKELIREYFSTNTIIGKILKFLFNDEQFYSTYCWARNHVKDSVLDLEITKLGKSFKYRPFRFFIYKRLLMTYWWQKKIMTIIFG